MKLTAIVAKGGRTGVLIDEEGNAQFALTKSVTVPARPHTGFSRRAIDNLSRYYGDWMLESVRKG